MRRQEYSYPVFLFSFNYILISTIYVSFSFLSFIVFGVVFKSADSLKKY